jgi:hypothetical protein
MIHFSRFVNFLRRVREPTLAVGGDHLAAVVVGGLLCPRWRIREFARERFPTSQDAPSGKFIADEVEVQNSQLWADEGAGYLRVGQQFNSHHQSTTAKASTSATVLGPTWPKAISRNSSGQRTARTTTSASNLDRYLARFETTRSSHASDEAGQPSLAFRTVERFSRSKRP